MPQRILLVDDEPDSLRMLGFALHSEGYQVAGAQTGREALHKMDVERPDLVILDVLMPDMNGFEICRRIRQKSDMAQLPIIMVTAIGREDDKMAGFAAGADDYMVKPVSLRELAARVRALLARRAPVAPAVPPNRAHIVAFAGVKGGVGTTTLAVNAAVAATQEGKNAILVDLHPYGGCVAAQLGHQPRATLETLLEQKPEAIEPGLLERCLLAHPSGLRVLSASFGPTKQPHDLTAEHVEVILNQLAGQTDLMILDLECALNLATQAALRRATRTVLVSEADHISLRMAQAWLSTLDALGIGGNSTSVVVVNRGRAAASMTKSEIEEMLKLELLALIVPEPELCLFASKMGVPVLLQGRDTPMEMQIRTLTRSLLR